MSIKLASPELNWVSQTRQSGTTERYDLRHSKTKRVCVWESEPDGWDPARFSIIHVLSALSSYETYTYTHRQDLHWSECFKSKETKMKVLRLSGGARTLLTTSIPACAHICCAYLATHTHTQISASTQFYLPDLFAWWWPMHLSEVIIFWHWAFCITCHFLSVVVKSIFFPLCL